jgi:hypothetical protein
MDHLTLIVGFILACKKIIEAADWLIVSISFNGTCMSTQEIAL